MYYLNPTLYKCRIQVIHNIISVTSLYLPLVKWRFSIEKRRFKCLMKSNNICVR